MQVKNVNGKLGLTGTAILFVLATLAACGGGGNGSGSATAPAPGSSSTTPPPDGSTGGPRPGNVAGFVYVANQGSANVSAYTINATTGALSAIAGSPFASGNAPRILTVDPSGRFVYVGSGNLSDSGSVSAYTINAATGALSEIAGSPYAAGIRSYSVAVDPSGKFAYVESFGPINGLGAISAYTINATTGALSEVAGSPIAVGADPLPITIDRLGKFAYVALGNHGSTGGVRTFAINATTGALTTVDAIVTTDGINPYSVIIAPSGKFAYVSNDQSIATYSIDATTGALTRVGAAVVTPIHSSSSTIDPSGKFVYVVNNTSVWASTINAATGELSEVAGSPFATGSGSGSFTVDPSGKFAYATNFGPPLSVAGNVSAFTINAATGALTEVAGSPFAAGGNPKSLTVDPSGRVAYVANFNSNDISTYTINTTTGALTSVGTVSAGTSPIALAITGTIL